MDPNRPVMLLKTEFARVNSAVLIPGSVAELRLFGLDALLPTVTRGNTVFHKKELATSQRYSPPNRMVCLPFPQEKLSLNCRSGVLRPCGKLVDVMIGLLTVE